MLDENIPVGLYVSLFRAHVTGSIFSKSLCLLRFIVSINDDGDDDDDAETKADDERRRVFSVDGIL